MNTPQAIPEPTPPKCPHCKQDMPTVDGYPYTLGSFVILSVACTKCKTLVHMGIMPLGRVSQEQEPEAKSPLWRPQ